LLSAGASSPKGTDAVPTLELITPKSELDADSLGCAPPYLSMSSGFSEHAEVQRTSVHVDQRRRSPDRLLEKNEGIPSRVPFHRVGHCTLSQPQPFTASSSEQNAFEPTHSSYRNEGEAGGTEFGIISAAASIQTNITSTSSPSSSRSLPTSLCVRSNGTSMTVVEALSTGSPAVLKDLIKRKLTSATTEELSAKLRKTDKHDHETERVLVWLNTQTKYFELKAEKTRLEIVKLRRELGM
uniref:RxLR-like protein n=1 Tax=Ascaris lumbricoides TaxID=6252 RepID=A0A0M3HTG4_ASCLU